MPVCVYIYIYIYTYVCMYACIFFKWSYATWGDNVPPEFIQHYSHVHVFRVDHLGPNTIRGLSMWKLVLHLSAAVD